METMKGVKREYGKYQFANGETVELTPYREVIITAPTFGAHADLENIQRAEYSLDGKSFCLVFKCGADSFTYILPLFEENYVAPQPKEKSLLERLLETKDI